MRLTILRTVILINAIATIAAGVVLFVFPAAIPSVVDITLAPDQAFVAWLLGAAEFTVAALCIGSVHSPSHDVLRLATTTLLVFHAASAVADAMALAQTFSLPIALNLALRIVMVILLASEAGGWGLPLAPPPRTGLPEPNLPPANPCAACPLPR